MVTCPVCGHQNADRLAESCGNCGAELIVEVAEETKQPPTAGSPPPGGGEPPRTEPPGSAGAGIPPVPPLPPSGGGSDGPPPQPAGSSIPFEDRSLPFSTRFFETVKMAFVDPVGLFSNVGDDSDIGPPVIYGAILGTVGMAVAVLWQLMFGSFLAAMNPMAPEEMAIQTGMLIFFLIFSPVLAVVGLFIGAGIYHLMLMLVGDGRRGFAVTLRVMAYGGTPQLIGIVPICGGVIGGIWAMVLFILGAIHGHKTEWWRAVIAYFLPVAACCCVLFFFWTAFLALIAGSN